MSIFADRKHEKVMTMEATLRTFTPEDWVEHEKYVQMFRAAKQRKREWEVRRIKELEIEEEYARKRRAEVDALFEGIDDETA